MINDVVNGLIRNLKSLEPLGNNHFYEFATDRVFRKDAKAYVLVADYRNYGQMPYSLGGAF